MKKFNCIFPGLYNYILTKDVGMIPYTLSQYYDTTITTYNNDNYEYMASLLKKDNMCLEFLENTGNEKKDVKGYIKKNAKNIDVIEFYHLRYNLLPSYIFTYKYHNKEGKIHLKLDANNDIIDFLVKRKGVMPTLRRQLVKILFKFIDVISIETLRNYEVLNESKLVNKDKLIYLPNGIIKTDADLEKEKTILYVGYIQKENKSIDMLISAISKMELNDWKLVLVGEIKEDMQEFFEEIFDKNPKLRNKIILKGYISNKTELSQEYAKSSIYCCTSLKESFGISTLEAAYHGNYVISTNVGGSPDIIEKTKYGQIIEHDEKILQKTLENTINNWDTIKKDPYIIQKIIYNHFSWDIICKKLNNKLL
ncbi:glycosyltransferase [Methanosphaera sp.]